MLSVPYELSDDRRFSIASGFISLVNTKVATSGFRLKVATGGQPPPPRLNRVHYYIENSIGGSAFSPQGAVILCYGDQASSTLETHFFIKAADQTGLRVINNLQQIGSVSVPSFRPFTTSTPPFVTTGQPSIGLMLGMFNRAGTANPYLTDAYLQDWGFALVVSLSPVALGTYEGCFFRYLPFKEPDWVNPNWVTKNQIREFGTRNIEAVYSSRRISEMLSASPGIFGQYLDEPFLGQVFFVGSLTASAAKNNLEHFNFAPL